MLVRQNKRRAIRQDRLLFACDESWGHHAGELARPHAPRVTANSPDGASRELHDSRRLIWHGSGSSHSTPPQHLRGRSPSLRRHLDHDTHGPSRGVATLLATGRQRHVGLPSSVVLPPVESAYGRGMCRPRDSAARGVRRAGCQSSSPTRTVTRWAPVGSRIPQQTRSFRRSITLMRLEIDTKCRRVSDPTARHRSHGLSKVSLRFQSAKQDVALGARSVEQPNGTTGS